MMVVMRVGLVLGGEDDDGFNWVLWVSVIVGVLILVLVIIWFFVLRNGKPPVSESGGVPSAPRPPGGPGASVGTVSKPMVAPVQNPVNNYLSNLNLSNK